MVVQTTAVFEGKNQMGILHATILQFQLEGMSGVDDLADFDKDSLKQLANNLHHPGGCIPDPNPVAVAGATIPMPAFHSGPSCKQDCQWHASLSGSTTLLGVTSQQQTCVGHMLARTSKHCETP